MNATLKTQNIKETVTARLSKTIPLAKISLVPKDKNKHQKTPSMLSFSSEGSKIDAPTSLEIQSKSQFEKTKIELLTQAL